MQYGTIILYVYLRGTEETTTYLVLIIVNFFFIFIFSFPKAKAECCTHSALTFFGDFFLQVVCVLYGL